jgi:hypothetical protein
MILLRQFTEGRVETSVRMNTLSITREGYRLPQGDDRGAHRRRNLLRVLATLSRICQRMPTLRGPYGPHRSRQGHATQERRRLQGRLEDRWSHQLRRGPRSWKYPSLGEGSLRHVTPRGDIERAVIQARDRLEVIQAFRLLARSVMELARAGGIRTGRMRRALFSKPRLEGKLKSPTESPLKPFHPRAV